MLTSFDLGNFKAFADKQKIPVRPLTLIYGANSSGKSSIIHGLLMAHEANRTGDLDVSGTDLGGFSVDLGGFLQFVHSHDPVRLVEWGVEICPENDAFLNAGNAHESGNVVVNITIGLEDPAIASTFAGEKPLSVRIKQIRIRTDGGFSLTADKSSDGRLLVKEFERGGSQGDFKINPEQAVRVRSRTRNKRGAPTDVLLVMRKLAPAGLMIQKRMEAGNKIGPPRGTRGTKDHGTVDPVLENKVASVGRLLDLEMSRLRYLGPLRSFPPRYFLSTRSMTDDPGRHGLDAYDTLRRDAAVRNSVNWWLANPERLSTPYQVVLEHFWTGRELLRRNVIQGLGKVCIDLFANTEETQRGDEEFFPRFEDASTLFWTNSSQPHRFQAHKILERHSPTYASSLCGICDPTPFSAIATSVWG